MCTFADFRTIQILIQFDYDGCDFYGDRCDDSGKKFDP